MRAHKRFLTVNDADANEREVHNGWLASQVHQPPSPELFVAHRHSFLRRFRGGCLLGSVGSKFLTAGDDAHSLGLRLSTGSGSERTSAGFTDTATRGNSDGEGEEDESEGWTSTDMTVTPGMVAGCLLR
jgi:hypothetical protein